MKLLVTLQYYSNLNETISNFCKFISEYKLSSCLIFSDSLIKLLDYNFIPENHVDLIGKIPQIDYFKCKFCSACVGACKSEAFVFNKALNTIEINPENCTECSNCFSRCKSNGSLIKSNFHFAKLEFKSSNEYCIIAKFFDVNKEINVFNHAIFLQLVSKFFDDVKLNILFTQDEIDKNKSNNNCIDYHLVLKRNNDSSDSIVLFDRDKTMSFDTLDEFFKFLIISLMQESKISI